MPGHFKKQNKNIPKDTIFKFLAIPMFFLQYIISSDLIFQWTYIFHFNKKMSFCLSQHRGLYRSYKNPPILDCRYGHTYWSASKAIHTGLPVWPYMLDCQYGPIYWTVIMALHTGLTVWPHKLDCQYGLTYWSASMAPHTGLPVWP